MSSVEQHVKVQEIIARVESLAAEGRYSDVGVVGKDLLPLILDEHHSVRLRIYHLLQRCPGVELSGEHRWHARAVAEDVMANRKSTPEERIHAHMLHLLLGPFTGSVPEGTRIDPNHRWLSQELREFYAEEAAVEILGRGGEGNQELQRDAHIVRCFTCPDHRSVEAHLEALLADGDETAIVQGCCGASEEFHRETACQFFHRALAVVKKERAIARLLEYKLSVLLGLYMRGTGDGKEEKGGLRAIYKDFIETMAHLELCGGAFLERAHGHIYFAMLADWYGDMALAEVHCDMAKAIAEHLQNPTFQEVVARYREWILSEDESAVEEGGEADEDDEEEHDYHGDDDDDGDDDADFWKKA